MRIKSFLYKKKKEWKEYIKALNVFASKKQDVVLPDFLIIGVQKGGTTWLYNILKAIPIVYMPKIENTSDPSEIRFFDERLSKGLRWYSRLFEKNKKNVKGDKTPKYYLMPKYKIRLIKMLQPNIKLIIVLRDPIARAWSDATMNLKRFDKADYETSKKRYHSYMQAKVHRGKYAMQLKKWNSVFNTDQIYIGIYEELVSNPEKILKELIKFLDLQDVDLNLLPIKEKYNVNPKLEIPIEVVKMLKKHMKDDYLELKKMYPKLSFDRWTYMS